MQVTVIREGRRGCGRRKSGACYLVSEPGEGILPLFVLVDPPVPYESEHFRGAVQIDLDAVLEGLPEDEWLVGASKDRFDKQSRDAVEVARWGMSLKERVQTGIGLDGLEELRMVNVRVVGSQLRGLSTLKLGKVQGEIPKAFTCIQKGDLQGLLACLWRLWRNCPPKQRVHAKNHVQGCMYYLNAIGDSIAVEGEFNG